MSASENESSPSLLSGFLLGPAWARATDPAKPAQARAESTSVRREAPDRSGDRSRESRDRGDRPERDPRGGRDDRRGGGDRRGRFQERRDGPPPVREILPAPGVRVSLFPNSEAVNLIGKEIHQVARVYSLFDVAEILLAERGRCRARFEVAASRPPLFHCTLDDGLFLTKEEALRHLWKPELITRILEVETIEIEPPTGNFTAVARCGFSGVWLGPPNHHAYQTNLRRLHRECFSHIPFDSFAAKVRTERSEEAVNSWLETMKTRQRWRVIGDDDEAWMEDKATAEHAVATRSFQDVVAEVHTVEITAGIASDCMSPSLWVCLRGAGFHVKRNPAVLIPAICAALESHHLPVFKRSGKLYTGPSRPHPLPEGISLAERPSRIVEWIRNNSPANLAGLWQAVHPTGGTEPCLEYVNDLFWLLNQGHVLLYSDDNLTLAGSREPEAQKSPRPPKAPKEGKRDRRSKDKPTVTAAVGDATQAPAESTTEPAGETTGTAATPEAAPEAIEPQPEATPEATPEAVEPQPEATPEAAPEAVEPQPEATPEATPEAVEPQPEAAPETVPEAVEPQPEAAPETVPEAVEPQPEAAPET
ncbi:MAG: hypothetical protein K9N23_20690, partial [Akkermansiaceae bacterium]|nr:hypothetical protein [Akkermansiaceae bacterium]